ncbi:Cell division cycle protein 27 -like protein, partial [Trichinella sp. T9]
LLSDMEDIKTIPEMVHTLLEYYMYDDAIEAAEFFHSIDKSEDALFLLASCYVRAGKFDMAINLINSKLITSTRLKYLLGRCYFAKQDKWDKAVIALSQVAGDSSLIGAFASSMLAFMHNRSQPMSALSNHRNALKKCPYLFTSLRGLLHLRRDFQPINFFPSIKKERTRLDDLQLLWRAEMIGQDPLFSQRLKLSTIPYSMLIPRCEFDISEEEEEEEESDMECSPPKYVSPWRQLKPANLCSGRHGGKGRKKRKTTSRKVRYTLEQVVDPLVVRENSNNTKDVNLPTEDLNNANNSVRTQSPSKLKKETPKPFVLVCSELSTLIKASLADEMRRNVIENCEKKKLHYDIRLLAETYCLVMEIEVALANYHFEEAHNRYYKLRRELRICPAALRAVARTYLEESNYKEAVYYYEMYHREYPHLTDDMDYYSTALWYLRRESSIAFLCCDMLNTAYDDPHTWAVLGNACSLKKRHELAIQCLERALELDKHYFYGHILLGHEWSALDDTDQADHYFKEALRLRPRHHSPWFSLGYVAFRSQDMENAEAYLLRSLSLNPKSPSIVCYLSLVLEARGRKRMAGQILNYTLKIAPNNTFCRFTRAVFYMSMRKFKMAQKELMDLKRIIPSEPIVYFLLGRVYKEMNEPHSAMVNFAHAVTLDPNLEQLQVMAHQNSREHRFSIMSLEGIIQPCRSRLNFPCVNHDDDMMIKLTTVSLLTGDSRVFVFIITNARLKCFPPPTTD